MWNVSVQRHFAFDLGGYRGHDLKSTSEYISA